MSDGLQPEHDPKIEFDGASRAMDSDPAVPGSDADQTVRLAGRGDPDDTAEELSARKRREQEAAARADVAQKAEEGKREKKDNSAKLKEEQQNNAGFAPEREKYEVHGLSRYGIRDKGDRLELKGRGRMHPMASTREVTDEQIRMLLMTAILNKGWTKELALYRGGRIDSQLTTRARMMMATDPALQKVCGERGMPEMQAVLKPEPPSWVKGHAYGEWKHKRRYEAQCKEAAKADAKTIKSVKKTLADKFTPPAGCPSVRDLLDGKENKKSQDDATTPQGGTDDSAPAGDTAPEDPQAQTSQRAAPPPSGPAA